VRILHINDYACLIGGAETYLARENGDIVALLASDSRGGGTFGIYPEERGYFDSQLYLAHGTSSSNQAIRAGLQLANFSSYRTAQRAIKEFRPEIVHVHMYLGQLSPMVLRPFIDLTIPLVHTSHSYRIVCPKGDRLLPGNVFCEKPAGFGCIGTCPPISYVHMKSREILHRKPQDVFQLVISPGSTMKRILEMERFPRVIHLPHGSNYKMREFIHGRNHAMDILYVGRLAFNKGVDNLIAAFGRVGRKFPHVRLRIAGDGPARASLEKMASNSLSSGSYEFLGMVDSTKVRDLQDRARLQCIPSVCPENSPIVIYEALTAGIPIVASNIGGIPDLVRNGTDGILVTPGNQDELVTAIEALFEDQACISFSQAAYERAKDFTMDKHVTALQKLYREVCESKGAR